MTLRPFFLLVFTFLLTASTAHSQAPSPPSEQAPGSWTTVDIGVIGTASQDILHEALEQVRRDGAVGLFIRLDTPGGALDATRTMVQEIMGAEFPVVVWVGPSGARAGSAGSFITLSANIAVMAPGANIGAAHPVEGDGSDIKKDLEKKVTNDTVAFMESIAQTRKRNVEVARSFVLSSASITAEEALQQGVIDLIGQDRDKIFEAINGRVIELGNGKKVTLATKGATFKAYERTLRQKVLEILSNPNLFYLLFLAGVIGLGYELTHPGVLFPGVAGAICLILAFIATSVLPVSIGFGLLMVLGIVLMVGEMFLPSFGVLGIGGFIAFVVGSVFVVDPHNQEGLRVSLTVIIPGAATLLAAMGGIAWLVMKTLKSKTISGQEGLVGTTGDLLHVLADGKGQARIQGEIWTVDGLDGEAKPGDVVRVKSFDGMRVHVTRN